MQNGSVIGQACLNTDLPSRSLLDKQKRGWKAAPDALKILVTEDCDDSFVLTELMLSTTLELTFADDDSQSEGSNSGESALPASVRQLLRAIDGEAALALIQQHQFDLVFMDVHMPGMDGYEAIRHIRAWEQHTGNGPMKIAVLSSDYLASQRVSTAGCGCVGFLRKPLRGEELAELLDRLQRSEAVA
jgi:CheY-like chemotaxis protein